MTRIVILKNTSGSDIDLTSLGMTLLTAEQRDISALSTAVLRDAPELITAIQTGDITVNDGTNDLSAALGEIYISYDVNDVLSSLIDSSGDGFIVKDGTSVHLRQVTGTTNQISITNADGLAGDVAIGVSSNLIIPGTGGTVVPSGTTGERPGSPTNGTIRYNTTNNEFEYYENGSWQQFNSSQNVFESIVGDSGSTTADIATDTLTIAGGTGISTAVSGDTLTITNDAPNVDQNLFQTIAVSGQSDVVADSTTDTLTLAEGTGITITTNATTDTITITNSSPNVDQNIWETIAADTGSTAANTTTDTLTIAGGTGISTSISGDTLTITNTGGSGSGTRHLTFGKKSDTNLTATLFEVTGGSTLGYVMPTAGTITGLGVITDSSNSLKYDILVNGVEETSTTFSSQISKTVTGLSVAYSADDIIQARLSGTVVDIQSEYTSDSYTLFLAHFNTEITSERHVINSSTICKGMSGRTHNSTTLGVSGKFNKAGDFDGSDDYIEILHHKNYDTQNITWECWFKADSTYGTDYLFSKDATGYGTGGHFAVYRSSSDLYVRSQTSSTDKTQAFGVSISTGTWYHVAVVLGSGGMKLFFDGTLKYSSGSWTQGWDGNRQPIIIGANAAASGECQSNNLDSYWKGRICEMRISNTRRYESSFSPSGSQFSVDANTIGLWHFDETSGNLIYDSSDTIHNAMMQTSGSFSTFDSSTKKFGAQSIKMNNSPNDWLRFIHNTYYEQTEITVEGWVNQYTDDYDGIILHKGSSSTEGGLIIKWIDIDNKIEVTYYGASTSRTILTGINSFNSFEWHHFAVTLDDSYFKLYIDGTLVGTEALTSDFQNVWLNNKDDVYIGSNGGSSEFLQAYIDEFRISNTIRAYGSATGNIKKVSMLVEVE